MLEIFIEGNKLDINEEFSIMLSFAIDDVRDFAAKNTTFSKTVVIPGTKNNNRLFGNIFDATISNDYDATKKNVGINFNASVSASVFVFNNNLQVMKGIMQLLEIINDDGFIEYEVGLFGELAGFTASLGASLLTGNMTTGGAANAALDLDFSSYNHNYTIANIVASWANANAGSGYYYPLIDYGTYGRNSAHTDFGKHSWIYKTFRPALFVKEYIDKIFAKSGYTYDSDLFNTTRFKSLVIPHNQKQLTKLTTNIMAASRSDSSHVIDSSTAVYVNLQFATFISSLFTASNINSRFTYTGANTNTFNFGYSITGNYVGQATGFNIRIKKNGVDISETIQNYPSTGTTFIQYYSYSGSTSVVFATGDYVEVEYQPSSNIYNSDYITATIGSIGITTLVPTLAPLVLGDLTDLNNTIPSNILKKDFISSICKLFNLYVYEDPTMDKHLKIAPFVDFFHLAVSIDWTYKLDRSKPIKLKPMSELTARYYEFLYKKDSDYWNDLYEKRYNITYNSYKYDSNYQLSKESQKVEIIFSGTPIVGYQAEDKVYSTIFKRTGTHAAPVEENVDSNIRILQAKLITGVTSWDILDALGTSVLGSYTNYPYAGHLDDPDAPTNDLSFGVPRELFFLLLAGTLNINQFNVYWASYLAEITDKDAKLLTANFKLAFKDISNLDFSKLIYLDGSLWRLNKIVDFNATEEDTCNVELIKVINKLY